MGGEGVFRGRAAHAVAAAAEHADEQLGRFELRLDRVDPEVLPEDRDRLVGGGVGDVAAGLAEGGGPKPAVAADPPAEFARLEPRPPGRPGE
jgi:hypothetical protein